ncbi:glycosyltransferase [Alsobacter sp. KACC 23698]|uniref:Glycosyltransferase n=1 Tax=Alsobacter sp. KACC 23698 TaxID=3149229 RepID=A0AAU7JJD9_9HYPH
MTVVLTYWGQRGGSYFTGCLAARMAQVLGPERLIVSGRATNPDLEMLAPPGVRTVHMRIPLFSSRDPRAWATGLKDVAGFPSFLAAEKPSHVVVAMNHLLAWPLVSRRPAGTKLVYVVHDVSPHPGDYGAVFQRFTQRKLLAQADIVVALSEASAAELRRLPAGEGGLRAGQPLVVAPIAGVSPVETATPKRVTPGEPVRFLLLGRMIHYKGLQLLADSVRQLPADGSWTLTVAGQAKADQQAAIEALARDAPAVRLQSGWLDRSAFVDLIAEHHVLLCPYTEASQSGVIPEAMSRATPSIVTPVGALPEQVGGSPPAAGLIAADVTAEAFAAAMLSIIRDPGRVEELSRGAVDRLAMTRAADPWPEILRGA